MKTLVRTLAALGLAFLMSATPTAWASENPTTIDVDVTINCDNQDTTSAAAQRQPILTWWDYGNWQWDPSVTGHDIDIVVAEVVGPNKVRPIGVITPTALPSPGYHDNWVGADVPIDGVTLVVAVIVDGVLVAQDATACPPQNVYTDGRTVSDWKDRIR